MSPSTLVTRGERVAARERLRALAASPHGLLRFRKDRLLYLPVKEMWRWAVTPTYAPVFWVADDIQCTSFAWQCFGYAGSMDRWLCGSWIHAPSTPTADALSPCSTEMQSLFVEITESGVPLVRLPLGTSMGTVVRWDTTDAVRLRDTANVIYHW